ncbi:hypothetical protein KSP39_PZI019533 [Platanthera zijinensis]|uniref:Uncharacterized protein n=1 Tax=Platanthera zijinensis TaxID=2320716 RepID=A0AAP0B1K7_9ASPA
MLVIDRGPSSSRGNSFRGVWQSLRDSYSRAKNPKAWILLANHQQGRGSLLQKMFPMSALCASSTSASLTSPLDHRSMALCHLGDGFDRPFPSIQWTEKVCTGDDQLLLQVDRG